MNYISYEYVVNLADKLLIENKCIKYQESLIDISTSNNKSETLSILGKIQDKPLENMFPHYLSLYRVIFNSKKIPLDVLIEEILKSYRVLHNQFLDGDGSSTVDADNYNFFFSMLDDYCCLKRDKLTVNVNINEFLNNFLSNYTYSINRFKKLNISIRDYNLNAII